MTGLAALLALDEIAPDRFAASTPYGEERRLFGGQLVAQALAAAARTGVPAHCHSLHGSFVSAGDLARPLEIAVLRLRDGHSFASRRADVLQDGRLVFTATLSFHAGGAGPEHAIAMPDVPPPEALEDQREVRRRNAAARGTQARFFSGEAFIEARPVELPADRSGGGVEGRRCLWFRPRERIADNPMHHQAAIAYASDLGLVHVALRPHLELGDGRPLDTASLDHCLWFHRSADANDWLLHVERSPVAAAGRGLALGAIFTRAGELVASAAQEILVRWRKEA